MKVIYDCRKDIRLIATGSASPILEKGSTDSGTGRWSILKIPTLSFYEYCRLLKLDIPELPEHIRLSSLVNMSNAELGDFMSRFINLQNHFNRYLTIGGFPELVLSDAIVKLCQDEKTKVTNAFLVTKQIDDFGIAKHETIIPIMRIPAIAFLYLHGKAEAEEQNYKI